MAPATATETEPDTRDPADRAEALREDLEAAEERIEEKSLDVAGLARDLASAFGDVQDAALEARRYRAELEVLSFAHNLDLDVPEPESEDAAREIVEAVAAIIEEGEREDRRDEVRARSIRSNLSSLRRAVRRGELKEVRRRIRAIRSGLEDEGLLGEDAEGKLLGRAREGALREARKQLRRNALRWCRGLALGWAPPPLEEDDWPGSVREVLEDFEDDPRAFEVPDRWTAENAHGRSVGPDARHLEDALTKAVQEVDDAVLLDEGTEG